MWYVKICKDCLTLSERRLDMETFGIIGFVFGLTALSKVIMLENKLKEDGVLKEKAESGKN